MSSPSKILARTLSGVNNLNLSVSAPSLEISHSGFLKYHAKVEGESTGNSTRRFFAITESGMLLHAEKQHLVR
jgi:hypothetical protein